MSQSWVKDFYKNQFEMLNLRIDSEMERELTIQAEEIIEQVGREFHKMLELGAGMGILAHALTQLGVSVTTIELVPEK
ncbi:hypothetical protein KDN24_24420 [Bacillus sp. Bva_UNVM-123]|uniref:hypothetical protein n=1 Tax=Bacillus sp. Bva_UNVM-123 TaxID=2829798 RepID=UPI00391F3F4D